MYRTEDEKRTDTKLGEAVLSLLREGAPVDEATLLLRLQQMLMTENDARSSEATFSAIRETEAALIMRRKANAAGRVLNQADASGLPGLTSKDTELQH